MTSILLSSIYICCVFSWNGLLCAKTGSGNDMLRDFQSLNNVVGELVQQNADMMNKLDELTKTTAHQDHKLSRLEAENERLKAILDNREDDAKALSRNNRILMMNPETYCNCNAKPAFTARLSKHLTSIGNQQTVKFDTVETNVGNAYSPLTGVFTAPVNGTYFFLASMLTLYGQYLETELVLNGNNIALMYGDNAQHDQGTNGAVVTLKQNDMVWVRHVRTEGSNVHGDNWSTFIGFQI